MSNKNLKVHVSDLVRDARAVIQEIDAEDAIALVDDPGVVIIDIRDVRERQKLGFIPGSLHCPRGMAEFWVDPESPYYNDVFAQDAKFIFHCASGWRSSLTVLALQNMGFENASHITNGFTSWQKAGGPVEMVKKS